MAQERFDSMSETAGIKREIEKTRVEMSETLGELQERLQPSHLMQQAKDTMTEAATGKMRNIMHSAGERATMVADQTRYAGRNVADYVRTHPVQMAMLAGGVPWWLLRGRDRSNDWAGASEGWQNADYGDDYGDSRPLRDRAGEYASTAKDAVGEYAAAAKNTVGEYAASARQAVGDAAESARYAAQHASERASAAARTASLRARDGWRQTTTSVDDWVHDYPVAAGLLALAVGAAIGMSVPATEVEDRAMGQRRDQALNRARAAARELTNDVTQKVQDAADSVIDAAADAAQIASDSARPTEGRA